MSQTPRKFSFAKGRTGRRPPGTMNKLEARYAEHLSVRQAAGEILAYWYEGVTLCLTYSRNGVAGQRYTPDFMVQLPDGTIELHEVKGFMDEKNINKVKVAADKYPFRFVLVTKRRKSDGGGWGLQEY